VVKVSNHLSVSALEERYKACSDATTARHVQAIWLLAQGHTAAQVSATMAFGERWVHQLLERYNAEGPDALGDLRRRNGRSATILTPAVLDKLRVRLADAPPDGGVWSSGKVAAYLAEQLGLEKVAVQRGWEALRAVGWSLQRPRPKNPKSASDTEAEALKTPVDSITTVFTPHSANQPASRLRSVVNVPKLRPGSAERSAPTAAICRVAPMSIVAALA